MVQLQTSRAIVNTTHTRRSTSLTAPGLSATLGPHYYYYYYLLVIEGQCPRLTQYCLAMLSRAAKFPDVCFEVQLYFTFNIQFLGFPKSPQILL